MLFVMLPIMLFVTLAMLALPASAQDPSVRIGNLWQVS